MMAMVVLFSVFALSTVGGVAFARAGANSQHADGSALGVLVCLLAVAVATIVVTATGLLHWV